MTSSNQLHIPVAIAGGALLAGSALLYWQLQKKEKELEEAQKRSSELEKTITQLKKVAKSTKHIHFGDEPTHVQPEHEQKKPTLGLTFPPLRGPKGKKQSEEPKCSSPRVKKRIAVMTSGGDSCGMNAALRAIVRLGIHAGAEMYVIYEGYTGLVTGGNMIKPADWDFVGGIVHKGGTVIGTARCAEFRNRDGRKTAAYNLVKEGIDCLIVIGGDGSLTGADLFRREWPDLLQQLVSEKVLDPKVIQENAQLSIVGLVGSIDNDMYGCDLTIGVDTALHRILEAIDAVLSTASSHRRTFIIEVMGRNCGYLALMAALSTGASWVFIPEAPPGEGWEQEIVERFNQAKQGGARCCMAIMAEGAIDMKGNQITCEHVRQVLAKAGHEARVTILGHVQRGGTPSIIDRNNSTLMGEEAIKTLFDAEYFGGSTLIANEGNKVIRLPLMKSVEHTKSIGVSMANRDFKKVIELRGDIFAQTYDLQQLLSDTAPRFNSTPPKRENIGIIHVGAPAPGMNTTVRVITRLALRRGYKVFGFKNGVSGLSDGNLQVLDWVSVNGWAILGGVNLGTVREHTTVDLEPIANTLKKYDIHMLIMIGGYDGYEFMSKLRSSRSKHDAFNIPLICIPASISNNLPATEAAIGADTALNNIVEAVDKIKQSSGISQRVFVIEVMGGYSGYLAVLSSLACGAEFTHIHERQLTLSELQEESNILIDRFKSGKNISLVIMNEKANPTYDTEFVFSLLKQEAHGLYEVRKCILGHLQQGGAPSPADRILASQLAMKVFQVIDENPDGDADELSVMVGVVHGKMVAKGLGLFPELVDHKFRRPKQGGQNCWWYPKLCELTDKLGTEPVTISKALMRQISDSPLVNSWADCDEQETGPRVYRSWTFQRFDYEDKDQKP